MLITAHGGAHNTGRNTLKYLNNIEKYKCDIIEVDIYRFSGKLIISHMPPLFPFRKRILLKDVFEIVKEKNVMVNCDLKMNGLKKEIVSLAKEVGVLDKILFTGNCSLKDHLTAEGGKIWFNNGFAGLKPIKENVKAILEKIRSYNNPCFAGLNINKKWATDEFLSECNKQGLELSIFTVDKQEDLARIAPYNVYNITTNIPIFARMYVGKTKEEAKSILEAQDTSKSVKLENIYK